MGGRTPGVSTSDEEVRASVGICEAADSVRREQQLPRRRPVSNVCPEGSGLSIKPRKELSGDPKHPHVVPSSKGLLKELVETAIVAPFNDVDATESLALLHRDDVAGIILEPVPMNMGYVQPEPGFLEGVRAVADEVGA